MSSEELTKYAIEFIFSNNCKNDFILLSDILSKFDNIDFVIDEITFNEAGFPYLLDKAIPNLDEGFRQKMINNFASIQQLTSKIQLIQELNNTKIVEYVDSKYVSTADISFFDHFPIDQVTKDQLVLLKTDPVSHETIQNTIKEFSKAFIALKNREFTKGTITIEELILFS